MGGQVTDLVMSVYEVTWTTYENQKFHFVAPSVEAALDLAVAHGGDKIARRCCEGHATWRYQVSSVRAICTVDAIYGRLSPEMAAELELARLGIK